jgi:hypothetical protein
MEKIEHYSIEEHLHRYACWTAARAASTSRFSNSEISKFITASGTKDALESLRQKDEITHSIYKEWFIVQSNALLKAMNDYKQPKAKKRKREFGIAAKILSIYIKTVEVIPTKGSSAIALVAFPPIDSFLLKGLKKELVIDNTSWSTMEENEYMEMIEKLKNFMREKPFWKLEYYWNLNN